MSGYVLSRTAAQQIRHVVKRVRQWEREQGPLPDQATGITALVYAKIVAHVSAGQHTAVQVTFDGSSWSTIANGMTWGNGAGEVGYLQEVNLAEISADVIVVAFCGGTQSSAIYWFCIGPGEDTDELVKVSANDTTAGYLNGKAVVTYTGQIAANQTPLVLEEMDDTGNESLLWKFMLSPLAAGGTLIGTELLLSSTDGAANNNVKTTAQQIVDLHVGDLIWINFVNNTAIHLPPDGNHTQANLTFQALDSTLTDPGGADTGRIDAIYAALITVENDVNGHTESVDGNTPDGPDTVSQYRKCGSYEIIYRANTVTDDVIELDNLYCYEYLGQVPSGAALNTDSITNTYSNPGACTACTGALDNYLWVLCSDGTTVCGIFSEGNQPDDSFAYVYYSGAYHPAKFLQMTSDAATDPCWVDDPDATPTDCSDIDRSWFSDAMDDNSVDTCRLKQGPQTGGTWNETGGSMVLAVTAGNSQGVASRIEEMTGNITGDFSLTLSWVGTTFSYPAGGGQEVAAAFYVNTASTVHGLQRIRNNSLGDGYRFLKSGSWGAITGGYSSTSGTMTISRSGSTITFDTGQGLTDTVSESNNIVNVRWYINGTGVACTVKFNNLGIT